MEPLTEREIRASFVNCTRGEVSRLAVPPVDEVAWSGLDFLGWVDPKAPQQAAVVVPHDGTVIGIKLRRNTPSGAGRRMCSWCCTVHPGSGVSLMVANRAGRAGREGNTTGVDVCADLRCSDYARGRAVPAAADVVRETISPQQRSDRLRRNLATFVRRTLR
ncbi:FBP domain-containing protein [Nocardioides sp.]|uniref:FBP domain-containing protein n=1 Tax=Nocardioides sp. TaxID=35761 RepID=UPI002610629F|nr:FBP domain-containing protein [Nocardioides sp.]